MNALELDGGTIQDTAGNGAQLNHDEIVADVTNRVDTAAPAVSTAIINGDELTLTYDEALDDSSVPSSSAYTLTLESGVVLTVADDGVAIGETTVRLTLSAAVVLTDVVTLTYTTATATNPVRDLVGNLAADLISQMVINNTDVTTGAVTEDDLDANIASGKLTLDGGFGVQDGTTNRANGLGTYGDFVLAANGAWTYTLDNNDFDTNRLAAGVRMTDVFTAVSERDANVTQAVTIIVIGANDAPVAVIAEAPTLTVTSGGSVTLTSIGSRDPDTDDVIESYIWTQTGGTPVVAHRRADRHGDLHGADGDDRGGIDLHAGGERRRGGFTSGDGDGDGDGHTRHRPGI